MVLSVIDDLGSDNVGLLRNMVKDYYLTNKKLLIKLNIIEDKIEFIIANHKDQSTV